MIGCLRTRVREQPIIVLYFESDTAGHSVCSDNFHASFEIFVLFVWFDVYIPVYNYGHVETDRAGIKLLTPRLATYYATGSGEFETHSHHCCREANKL